MGTVGTRVVVDSDIEPGVASAENINVSNSGEQEVVTIQGASTSILEQTSTRASNGESSGTVVSVDYPGNKVDSPSHPTVSQPSPKMAVSEVSQWGTLSASPHRVDRVSSPHRANRVSSTMDGTGNYLKTINSCPDICSAMVEKPIVPLVGPMTLASDSNLMDKGGTKSW